MRNSHGLDCVQLDKRLNKETVSFYVVLTGENLLNIGHFAIHFRTRHHVDIHDNEMSLHSRKVIRNV